MTNKDKTRDKLVGSMRKTKAAADIGTDSAEAENVAGAAGVENVVDTTAKTTVKKMPETAVETKAAQAAAETGRNAVSTSQSARPRADGYQSGRRVWPD